MKVIGLTAPIGCGKSYIASIFASNGIPTIDSDEVYHSLLSPNSDMITNISNIFGSGVVTPKGELDRKALAAIVFSDKEKLEKLNQITHGAVVQNILDIISQHTQSGDKAVTVQVPLMFESGFEKHCDTVICVSAELDTRIDRICKRDNCNKEEALKKVNNQKDIQFYIAKSDKVVYNNNYDDPHTQVLTLLKELGLSTSAPKG